MKKPKQSNQRGLFLASPYPLAGITGIGRFTRDLQKVLDSHGTKVLVLAPASVESWSDRSYEGLRLRWKVFRNLELAALTARSAIERRREFQTIHVQQAHLQSLLTMITGRILGKRSVLTLHVRVPMPAGTLRKMVQSVIERSCVWFSSITVAVSPLVASDYPGSTAQVVENGVDTDHFRRIESRRSKLRAQLGLGKEVVFLYSSRWTWAKGFDVLLHALNSNKLAHQVFRVLLLGEVPSEEPLDMTRGFTNVVSSRRVIAVGPVPDVAEYLGVADIFVLPSRYEGLPLAVLEAMASELPAILSDIPIHQLLVARAQAGWTFRSGDSEDLAAKMASAIQNGIPPSWGPRLRKAVLDHNRLEEMVQAYVTIYERLAQIV